MTKYANPFHTINEAIAILKSRGLNPLCNLPDGRADWREEILGVTTHRRYANGGIYHEFQIHLTDKGFREVSRLIGTEDVVAEVSSFTDEYDKVAMIPSPLLELFALIPKGTEATL